MLYEFLINCEGGGREGGGLGFLSAGTEGGEVGGGGGGSCT